MKKIFTIIFIMLITITTNSCVDPQTNNSDYEEDNMPLGVSIIQLIANPVEYHGKKIRVDGVANLSVGARAIYLCTEHWYYMSNRNALWVSIESKYIDYEDGSYEHWYYINDEWVVYEDAQHYNGKYVLIEGTFDMYEIGNRGMFSGGIVNVTRFSDFSNFHRDIIP